MTSLKGIGTHIDPSVVQLFRMHPIPVDRRPGWHIRSIPPDRRNPNPFDVLVPIRAPRGGLPRSLQPGESYHFWVDLSIPQGTFEGIYTGEIELWAGERKVTALLMQLTVWPFILPEEADVAVIAELDHRSLFRHHLSRYGRPYAPGTDDWRHDPLESEFDALLDSTMRTLRSHRLTPVLPLLSPTVKVGGSGELLLNWDQYDAVVERYLDGSAFANRAGLRYWTMPCRDVFSTTDRPGVSSSPGILEKYMAACAHHFVRKGWLERSYAAPLLDLPLSAEAIANTKQFARIVRQADGRIPILSPLFPQDPRPYGWLDYPYEDLSEGVDIWMPPGQFFDAEVMAGQRAEGRRTWMMTDRPPFTGSISIDAPSTFVRVLTWQAAELGSEVLYIGCVNAWPDAGESPGPEECCRRDPNVLLYPGGPFGLDEPIPSVRLKLLRRSLEDAAYCRILREHDLEHVTTTLRRSLAPFGGCGAYRTHFADGRPIGWPTDSQPFEAARCIMAEELMSASPGAVSKGSTQTMARTVSWRRFMEGTRRVQLAVDGVRVRLPTSDTPAAEVECALSITNATRLPMDGLLRFGELPVDWTSETNPQTIPAVLPNDSRRVTLTARATGMATGPGGFLTLPIELATTQEAVYRINARLAFVAAAPRNAPLQMDGDLADWPLGTTNVASDFVLITGEYGESPGAPQIHPRQETTAFAMSDDEFLYLAVNCAQDEADIAAPIRRKAIHYDDLIPVGEDLIEILVDPLNAGTRSPSDLYHIAIKRSGPFLAERGIASDPPCGRATPWPVDLEYAIGQTPRRWTVELRIPLTAFETPLTNPTVWGFNITRYDEANQEFSTWSGAVGNAYDPLSLGNLQLR